MAIHGFHGLSRGRKVILVCKLLGWPVPGYWIKPTSEAASDLLPLPPFPLPSPPPPGFRTPGLLPVFCFAASFHPPILPSQLLTSFLPFCNLCVFSWVLGFFAGTNQINGFRENPQIAKFGRSLCTYTYMERKFLMVEAKAYQDAVAEM